MCLDESIHASCVTQRLVNARSSLLNLQEVVAKRNEAIRVRYPHSDALHKSFERALMGVFNGIPMRGHAFAHAAENLAYERRGESPVHPANLFSEGISDVLKRAMSCAKAPQRNKRGVIQWKKSVSHIETHLAREIGVKADVFFKDVYSLPGIDAKALKTEERKFRSRYRQMMKTHTRAKLDKEAKRDVREALAKHLPDAICWSICAYVQ